MEVRLITTGTMEFHALAPALGRLFRDHTFSVVEKTSGQHFDGITSSPLRPGGVSDSVRKTIDIIVAEAAAQASMWEKSRTPGLIFIVDDLELANQTAPGVVTAALAQAFTAHIDGLANQDNRDRTRSAVRRRVSLHFAAPMIESWLFADPQGLENAGVPPDRPALLGCGPALEDFDVIDPLYQQGDCSQCTKWAQLQRTPRRLTRSKIKANRPEWCDRAMADNRRHPKRYLAWLCRDHSAKRCSTYREHNGRDPTTPTGATALAQLGWSQVLSGAVQMPFLNALIEDLAAGLLEPCPLPASAALAPETARKPQAVLRNI